jgi:hypothetical protein
MTVEEFLNPVDVQMNQLMAAFRDSGEILRREMMKNTSLSLTLWFTFNPQQYVREVLRPAAEEYKRELRHLSRQVQGPPDPDLLSTLPHKEPTYYLPFNRASARIERLEHLVSDLKHRVSELERNEPEEPAS